MNEVRDQFGNRFPRPPDRSPSHNTGLQFTGPPPVRPFIGSRPLPDDPGFGVQDVEIARRRSEIVYRVLIALAVANLIATAVVAFMIGSIS